MTPPDRMAMMVSDEHNQRIHDWTRDKLAGLQIVDWDRCSIDIDGVHFTSLHAVNREFYRRMLNITNPGWWRNLL